MRGTSKAPPSSSKSKTLKRLRTRFGVPAALIAVLVLALPGSASALGLGEQEEFFAPTQPTKPLALTEGPEGNVWYTNDASTKIGKVTPAGAVTEYSPGLSGPALDITAGPDGNVWFTVPSTQKVGYIDPSEPTTSLQEFSVPNIIPFEGSWITAGPDGNLWVTLSELGIARVTPAGVVTNFSTGLNEEANVCSIIPGPDGNVWFGDCGPTRAVGKITPAGAITEYEVEGSNANRPHSITLGSDGRIWFSANGSTEERIGAITTAGVAAYYNTGLETGPAGLNLNGLATGADGNVWARESASKNETQKVTLETTSGSLGGNYKLSFMGDETEPIAFNAAGSVVEAKLGALLSIGGVANVKVIDILTNANKIERTVEFEGKFARTNVSALSCNETELTGTGKSCTFITEESFPQRLYRIKPDGEVTAFPLEPQTVGASMGSFTGKMGTLVSGPDNSLWFTTAGDVNFPSTPAIGKFGLGIDPPVEGPPLTLKVEEGSGTVVSNPAGLECTKSAPESCVTEEIEEGSVVLTASPAANNLFKSWKGCTSVEGRKCTVSLTEPGKTVGVKFSPAHAVTIEKSNNGLGSVSGVTCGYTCTEATTSFADTKVVKLKAKAYKTADFTGWSGDVPPACETGTPEECVLPAEAGDKTVEAEFTEKAKQTLTVNKTGDGQGLVKSSPAGINCSYTCSSNEVYFYDGTTVTLTATVQAGKGSTFGGWSGAGCSGTGTCVVSMTEAKSVTAEFK